MIPEWRRTLYLLKENHSLSSRRDIEAMVFQRGNRTSHYANRLDTRLGVTHGMLESTCLIGYSLETEHDHWRDRSAASSDNPESLEEQHVINQIYLA